MGYAHTFYAIDLERLRELHGSADATFAEELFAAKAEEIEDNDAFFDDAIDEGEVPDTCQALRDILSGEVRRDKRCAAMYGYALGVLCDHLGTFVEVDDVCDVSRHPYKSRLVSSGPPLPIPVDRGDFPEIGYVERVDLAAEMEAIDQAPRRGKRSLMSRLTGGVIGGGMDDDELAEDMRAYRAALAFAEERGLTLLSLRH